MSTSDADVTDPNAKGADTTPPPLRRGPWTTLAVRPAYANPWIEVAEHDVLDPSGRPGLYGIVSPRHLAIGVLPIFADATTVLVGQYRYALDEYSWEMPEGGGQKGVAPQESAARELAEETGFEADGWAALQRIHLSNSISDEVAINFLAWDLRPVRGGATPETTEADLVSARVPFVSVLERVLAGDITDSLTASMVLLVEVLRGRGGLPAPVAHALR